MKEQITLTKDGSRFYVHATINPGSVPDLFNTAVSRQVIVEANGKVLADVTIAAGATPQYNYPDFLLSWPTGDGDVQALNFPWESPPVMAYIRRVTAGDPNIADYAGPAKFTLKVGGTTVVRTGSMSSGFASLS